MYTEKGGIRGLKKVLLGLLVVVLVLRLATYAGATEAMSNWVREIAEDGSLVSATLRLDKDSARQEEYESNADHDEEAYSGSSSYQMLPVTPFIEDEPEADITLIDALPVTITSDVSVKNDTSYDLDIAALAAEGLSLTLNADEPQILIIHTHSSEAYAQDPDDPYEESDPSRTEDKNHNIIRVGDELEQALSEYGLNVIHDRNVYDYPSYTGSYKASGEAVSSYLAEYPSIAIVFDIHRDAIGSDDTVYKTQAEIPGVNSAQVMILVTNGELGLDHPNWKENLKLALYMQSAAESKYSTLMRPISLKPERYNLHLSTGSMIIEVGSTGNTLDEALVAINLFAKAVGPALAELIV